MSETDKFQGVACYTFDKSKSVQDTIYKLLDLNDTIAHNKITCQVLKLKNKYYQANVHLFEKLDEGGTTDAEVLKDCQAVILHCDGQRITYDLLEEKVKMFDAVGGEPRILLYEGIDEECPNHKTVVDWCIQRGYDFIDASDKENAKTELINSLSAYKWTHMTNDEADILESDSNSDANERQLDDETLKKLMDFDSLLSKLSAYKEKPEMRGDPNDKNIMEIAEILSGLLGNDVDDFLEGEQELD